MAGLKDDAQWIVMMGFVISFSFFFLAMILNQSTVVGQTTAEGVMEFPKNDIRDAKDIVVRSSLLYSSGQFSDSQLADVQNDIHMLALSRKSAIVNFTVTDSPRGKSIVTDPHTYVTFHYNNGVTEYHEYWVSP